MPHRQEAAESNDGGVRRIAFIPEGSRRRDPSGVDSFSRNATGGVAASTTG